MKMEYKSRAMHRANGSTRFSFEIRDEAKGDLKKAREILEDVEGKTALIKDALVYYINSKDFNLERYEGPGHRRADK